MELREFAWWFFALVGVGFLFLLMLLSYLMCHYFIRVEEAQYVARSDLDPNYLDSNSLEVTTLEPNDLYAPVIRIRRRYRVWSARTTHTFIAIVLSCTGVYMISLYPEVTSPFWLGFVLQAFIYASAFLFYKTWRKGEE